MSRPCAVHQWSHLTEPCPYCREISSQARHPRPHMGRRHETASSPTDANATDPNITDPNTRRAERLSAAIVAAISGDASRVTELFTQDVVGSGPAISVSSREELAIEIEEREGALTDIEVALAPLEVTGTQAAVEWVASGVQAGALVPDDSGTGVAAPTGRRVRMRAITVAEFDGEQICSFRSYWEDLPRLQDGRETPSN